MPFLIFRLLLRHGADKTILTEDKERPIDLIEPTDFEAVSAILSPLENQDDCCDGNSDDESDDDEKKGNSR